jgi:hypothetical protein
MVLARLALLFTLALLPGLCSSPIAIAQPAEPEPEPEPTIVWRHDLPAPPDLTLFDWQRADVEADRRLAEAATRQAIALARLADAAERQAGAALRLVEATQRQADAAEATLTRLDRLTTAVASLEVTAHVAAEVALPAEVRDRLIEAMAAVTAWLGPPGPAPQ